MWACTSPTPRDQYTRQLSKDPNVTEAQIAAWDSVAQAALYDSLIIKPPIRIHARFAPDVPSALAYTINMQRGHRLEVKLDSAVSDRLFIELLQLDSQKTGVYRMVEVLLPPANELIYEAHEAGDYLLRLQPKLGDSVALGLVLQLNPSLHFPVADRSNSAIWSFFGDPRDAGRRSHHGIDIFAPRGTPVLCAARGIVRSVRDRGLGGKQVWVYDPARNFSLYYAHLDSQLVYTGQAVSPGDTLGTVGNTGNARNTRPHLHFGIYARGEGPIDPLPFVWEHSTTTDALVAEPVTVGTQVRIRERESAVRSAPMSRAPVVRSLPRDSLLEVLAVSGAWYQVRTPDGTTGFVWHRSVSETLD